MSATLRLRLRLVDNIACASGLWTTVSFLLTHHRNAITQFSRAQDRHDGFLGQLFEIVTTNGPREDHFVIGLLDRQFPQGRDRTLPQNLVRSRLQHDRGYHKSILLPFSNRRRSSSPGTPPHPAAN